MPAPRWLDPRRTFGTRLTIIIVSLVLLTLATATLVTLRVARASLTDQVGDNFQGQAESVSELVQLYLTGNINEVQQLAASHELVTAAAERNATYQGTSERILAQLITLDEQWRSAPASDPLIQSVVVGPSSEDDPVTHAIADPVGNNLSKFLDIFEEHRELFLTDRYGGTISATARPPDYYRAGEDWWQAAWNDGAGAVYVSSPEYDVSAEVTALLIAVPVIDDGGSLVGILRSTLSIDELYGLLANTTLGQTGYAALLGVDGTQLLDPGVGTSRSLFVLPADMLEQLTGPAASSLAGAGAIFGHGPLAMSEPSFQNATETEASAADAVAGLGWHVIIRQDTSEALSTLNLIERVAWISGAIAMLIGTLAAVFIAQAVTRPLTRLAAAARDIGAGKLDTPLPRPGRDEIGGLTSAFHTMTEQLRQKIGALKLRTDEVSQANASLMQEVEERKQAEKALQRYVSLAENSSDFVGIATLDGQVTFVNKAGLKLVGLDCLEDAQSRTMFEFLLNDDLPAFEHQVVPEVMRTGRWQGELRLRHFKTGVAIPIDMNTFTINRDADGRIFRSRSVWSDITERKRAERALVERKEQLEIHTREIEYINQHLAETQEALERSLEAERERARRDPLTGVLNHAAIVDELRALVSVHDDSVSHAVAMVDLDGLKAVNDTFGHQVGDQVLVALADALARGGATVGRYGGDEFVVILPGQNREEAERYQDDVMTDLQTRGVEDPESGATIPVKTSIGIAIFPEEADSVTDLIALSDSSMYVMKRQRAMAQGSLTSSREDERASQMVGQIVPLLTSFGDLTEKLQLVARRLAVGAGYDAVNFTLFQEVTGQALSNTSYPPVPKEFVERWDRAQQPNSESHPATLLLAQTLRPLILDDPWNDERLWESERNVLRAAQLQSVLIAPMIWQGEMIGTIGVAAKQPAAFAAADAQFLSAIATQVTAIVRMETLVDKLSSTTKQLSHSQEETVLLLAAAAEAHDHTTGLHLQSVRGLTEALAREMGLDEEEARALGLAAVLHDIGKIRVPDAILASPGKLAPDQWNVMRQHTIWGASFLAGHDGFELAAAIARSHHERWDGAGYPDGLSGNSIPQGATVVTVADAFDAMTHDRPYRASQPVDEAIKEIVRHAGKQFSPAVVEALERLYRRNELPVTHPDASVADAA